jgi:8-amino-7-oxononanoate synthase
MSVRPFPDALSFTAADWPQFKRQTIMSKLPSSNDPLAWVAEALSELERRELRRRLAVRSGAQRACVELDGRELVNFGSNDYLGLAADERVIAAALAASEREGWGSGASPLVSGRGESQAALERRLAEFEGTEAALVFSSGFAANAGIIPALVEEPDAIFGDAKNHASLIDGCRLSKATRFVYPHADCEALEAMLREGGRFRRRLIVTDTVFSMDGDIAPLARIAKLAERYQAMLMVDEAHATGVFGAHGGGIVEQSELQQRVHVRVGTLSKSLGSGGGFVCGRQTLIDWLANRARTYVFSTAQPGPTHAAALAALDIVRDEPQRRRQLLATAAEVRQRLQAHDWNTGPSESQIVPIIVGDAGRTMRLAAQLREVGFFVPGIRPPSVPEGESLLRLSLCYHHTPAMIDGLLESLGRLSGTRERPTVASDGGG